MYILFSFPNDCGIGKRATDSCLHLLFVKSNVNIHICKEQKKKWKESKLIIKMNICLKFGSVQNHLVPV